MKQPTKIVRVVCVFCPDKYELHKNSPDGLYVRYALLFTADNQCVGWLDDPSEFDLHGLIFDTGIQAEWVPGLCVWCKAKASAS